MGCLYKQKSSRVWWVKYYVNGRPIRESTGTDKESEGRRFLKDREGRVATGQPILPRVDRIGTRRSHGTFASTIRPREHGIPKRPKRDSSTWIGFLQAVA